MIRYRFFNWLEKVAIKLNCRFLEGEYNDFSAIAGKRYGFNRMVGRNFDDAIVKQIGV